MTQEVKEYVNNNLPTIDLWIRQNEKLQPSMDFLQPIIKDFEADPISKGKNLNGCPECIIDMLRWARKEAKDETKEGKTKTPDKKGGEANKV